MEIQIIKRLPVGRERDVAIRVVDTVVEQLERQFDQSLLMVAAR